MDQGNWINDLRNQSTVKDLFWLNVIFDSIFGIDIIVNFRTSFTNTMTGDEVTDLKQIA